MIVTTNFDRLLEQALEAEGVMPTIISSAHDAQGATPFAHTRCTVIKLHGDYLDTPIKNTGEELSRYDEPVSVLLDRVLDEHGLVISGWSGAWDVALVKAIKRISTRRYTTFWTIKDPMTQAARDLARFRCAEILQIADANTFFKSLHEKVLSIAQFNAEYPLTTIATVASLKRFLQDPSRRIDLYDLVIGEACSVKEKVESLQLPVEPSGIDSLITRLQEYEAIAARPVAFFSTLAFFSKKAHYPLILKALRWFISPARLQTRDAWYEDARLHPAVLVFYAMAVAAVQGGKPELLKVLFLDLKVRDDRDTNKPEEPAIRHRLPKHVVRDDTARKFPGCTGRSAPMPDRYFATLNPFSANLCTLSADMFPTESEFATAFHVVEILASLWHLDHMSQTGAQHPFPPDGHFWYHDRLASESTLHKLGVEAERDYPASTIGRSGLFLSAEQFKSVYQRLTELMAQHRRF